MKKKILAAALAGAMILSNAVVVSAKDLVEDDFTDGVIDFTTESCDSPAWQEGVGIVVDGTGGWNSGGSGITFPVTEDGVTVTFKNEPFIDAKPISPDNEAQDQLWDNFVFEVLSNEAETDSLTFRADNYYWSFSGDYIGDITITSETSWDSSFAHEDWETVFRPACKGNIEITAKKVDNTTVTFHVQYLNDQTDDYTIKYPNGVPANLTFWIGADGGKVTLLSAVYGEPNDDVERQYTDCYSVTEGGVSVPFTLKKAENVDVKDLSKDDAPNVVIIRVNEDGEIGDEDKIEFGEESVQIEGLPEEIQKQLDDSWEKWLTSLGFITNEGTVSAVKLGDCLLFRLEVGEIANPENPDAEIEKVEYELTINLTEPDDMYFVGIAYTDKTEVEVDEDNIDWDLGVEYIPEFEAGDFFDDPRAYTDGFMITEEGIDVIFKSVTEKEHTGWYEAPAYVAYTNKEGKVGGENYKEYFYARADVWGWANGDDKNQAVNNLPEGYEWNSSWPEALGWDPWQALCREGVIGTVNAINKDGKVTINFAVDISTSTASFPVVLEGVTPFVSLAGEHCTLTDIVKTPKGFDKDLYAMIYDAFYAKEDDGNGEEKPGGSTGGNNTENSGTSTPSTPSDDTDNTPTTKPDVTTNTTLKSDDGTVAVSGNLPAGVVKVNVVAPTIKAGDTKATFDITLLDGNGNPVQLSEGQKVTVTIKIPDEFKSAKELFVYYQKNGKIVENMNAKKSADGTTISFETTHFSEYVISTTALKVESENNPTTGVALVLIPAVAAAAAVLVSKKRK